MQTTIFIGVGSNIDPQRNVLLALEALQARVQVEACSTFYWSAPLERPEQQQFLNGVWQARTSLGAREIKFDVLRALEHDLGRRRESDKHAARPIDLDLLLYGDANIREPDMLIPDPEIALRAFLWQPLRELAPERVDGLSPLTPGALEPATQITLEMRAALSTTPQS